MHPAIRTTLLTLVSLAALTSCGGLSDVGEQETVGPHAVVTVLGHPYTAASDGSATATVRAQTEVVLTAKDSVEGSAPITQFTFEQTDSNAKLPIVVRTRNTIAFAFPTVAIETPYTFKLTVTDSNGETSTANASFTVSPVLDPNRFLSYINSVNTYRIVVAPTTAIAANPSAAADASSGDFQVVVKRQLTYTDRAGSAPLTDIGLDSPPASAASHAPAPVQIDGVWLTQLGATANCNPGTAALENRQFDLDIPSIDQDDINLLTQAVGNSPQLTGNRTEQLELGDIDAASLSLEISVAQRTAGGPAPLICVFKFDSDGTPSLLAGPATTGRFNIADLKGEASESQDTLISAIRYYEAIGAATSKTTFFSWLRANGFDPAATNYGADAHAVYTNNFDLGFGRDMYMKVTCAGGSVTIGNCDVASVVVNYPSLENAAKKLSPINAVAMEYSGPQAGSRRFVKFYAYAPNPRDPDGDFRRIHSVNLDGRGEKSVPGSCTVCHSGTPGGIVGGEYGNGGDLNSAFLPWDLDSLLFGDTDTSFSGNPEDVALKGTLTRAAQEAELRKLNAGAYLTFDDSLTPGRFAIAQELIKGWYEEAALPVQNLAQVLGGTHAGGFVPPDWQPSANGNPPDSADVYNRVFAQNCRMCHAMHIPSAAAGDPHRADLCDEDQTIINPNGQPGVEPRIGIPQQVPMACYWQFAKAPNLAQRLSEGFMPFARLTSDRLWTLRGSDGKTAGVFLIEHLARDDTIEQTVTVPGTPAASIVTTPDTGDIGTSIKLETADTRFVRSLVWSVKRCTEDGNIDSCTVDVPVAAPSSPVASFQIAATGDHLVQVRLNGQSTAADSKSVLVPEKSPTLSGDTAQTFNVGGSLPIADLFPNTGLGNGQRSQHVLSITAAPPITLSAPACLAPSTCPADTNVFVGVNSTTAMTSLPFTVSVKDVNDAQAVTRNYTLTTTATLSAPTITLCTSANAVTSSLNNCMGSSSVATADMLASFATSPDLSNLGVAFPPTAQLSLVNAAGARGSVTLSGSPRVRFVAYTPPARISTHAQNGTPGLLTSGGQEVFDQIAYTLIKFNGDVPMETANGVLRFRVLARSTFEVAFIGTFRSATNGCSLCHRAGGGGVGAPNFSDRNATGNDLNTPDTVYDLLRNATTGDFNSLSKLSRPYVALPPTLATQSGLYCWPSVVAPDGCTVTAPPTTSHNGGTILPDVLLPILIWIEDGGNRF